ncbi:hypothetical protein S40293_05040 [Stachybotrys chartarum IBT 40293]|nr:hypothetical protein S40293_05040 [Stachybotrys chartarum IBT 40293]KFA81197.1 hypothetical protein S40288_07507 [Stachybotrys chartarum IBT 40288]
MKLFQLSTLMSTAAAVTIPEWASYFRWTAPGPGDVRGPCPMLNTLANHGYLPHDGRTIDHDITLSALDKALNIDGEMGGLLFEFALTTNPEPNATYFSLEDLSRHNVLEHDASLSRADFALFNDSRTFHRPTYDETRSYWTGEFVDVQMAANARYARLQTANATNPSFSLSELGFQFGAGETAAYILVLGDRMSGTVRRSWLEYFFENERLPVELGWRPQDNAVSVSDLDDMLSRILAATPGAENTRKVKARSIHGSA